MKKKLLMILLGMTIVFSGCSAAGQRETLEPGTAEEQEEALEEEEAEDIQAKEINSYLVAILEVKADRDYEACDSNNQSYHIILDDDFPDSQKNIFSEGAVVRIEAWSSEENESDVKTLYVVDAGMAEDTLETEEMKKAAFEKINGFSVDDSIVAVMYAKQTVNIRKGPSADYEKLGTLSAGEEVSVTGMADNGWYRIAYEEMDAYVSNDYLSTIEPMSVASSAGAGASGGSSSAANNGGNDINLNLPYSEAEIDAAMNSGDLKRAMEMNQANLDALNGKTPAGGSSSGSAGSPPPVDKNLSTSSEFVNYLNSQREAAGLSRLEWSDSLSQTAKERAGEIVDDFSHNGSRNCSGEIITQTSSGDVASWYSNFYNSSGHKAHMMDAGLYTKVGAGVCQAGNRYYVVVLFDYMDR